LAEDLAGPFGLDLRIGLPDSEHARAAEVQRPTALADFGEINAPTRAAFLTRWASPGGKGGAAQWRRAELPGVNGHATAAALARLMSVLACGGRLDGRPVLSPQTVAAAARQRIVGQDLVLPFVISWGAGFMRNAPNMIYGPDPDAFGHSGWGGSCAFADPEKRVSAAYVMNRQSAHLIGDPRPLGLIEALYAAL
jgi:CubicO group peptidase (beta-lactamase class C family)